MTTITYDGKTLAVDSQITSEMGLIVSKKCNKLYEISEHEHLAICGDRALFEDFAQAVADRDSESMFDSDDIVTGVLFNTQTKECFEIDSQFRMIRIEPPYARGSGEAVALTALHCGKNAVQAIEVACELDVYTGGRVNHVSI